MINVAGLNYPALTKKNQDEHPFKISSMECFDKYEQIQQAEFISTMLMVHLADKHVSPTGWVMFTGNKNALHGLSNAAALEHVAKSTVMQQALNLSVNKLREDIVFENCNVNTFICTTLL